MYKDSCINRTMKILIIIEKHRVEKEKMDMKDFVRMGNKINNDF